MKYQLAGKDIFISMSSLHLLCKQLGHFLPRLRLCRNMCWPVTRLWQCMGMHAELVNLATLCSRAYALPLPWWDMHRVVAKDNR